MYTQLDPSMLDAIIDDSQSSVMRDEDQAILMKSSEKREKFVDNFLSEYLNSDRLKEKDTLRGKIKYKHHQLEVASKALRKAKSNEKVKNALAAGVEVKNLEETLKANANKSKTPTINFKLKKKLNLYKLNKDTELEYEKYEKINKLWMNYAYECLATCLPPSLVALEESVGDQHARANEPCLREENVLNCLKQLDYHGCSLKVIKSKCKCLIGISGIVLQDKRNIFALLTKENKIKFVPKQGNLFEFRLFDSIKMCLVGSNICYRPEIRTTKHAKIKTKLDII
jgi:RNase P/RNase MRP subunit p29